MDELCWLNGKLVPMAEALIPVEDRGMLFADGVYEVFRIYDGEPFALDAHLDRLRRSCDGIELKMPWTNAAIRAAAEELIAAMKPTSATVYLQVTRGGGPRQHLFPKNPQPTLFMITRPLPAPTMPNEVRGQKLMTVPDDRWHRCWIKSIALLPNILAKNKADQSGADEAVFVESAIAGGVGMMNEGSSSNVFIIREGMLTTPTIGAKVLPGITRDVVLDLARGRGIAVDERHPTLAECLSADEVFITSTTREIAWVERWDDQVIGEGKPGPMTMRLAGALREYVGAEVTK